MVTFWSVPINRLIDKTVSGLMTACLLAASPIISSPFALNATAEGVVFLPSGFGITFTFPSAWT